MSLVAPTFEAFFTQRFVTQKNASPHTIASCRDCLEQLLAYAQDTTGVAPSKLDFSDLDATVIGGFLHHLEREPGTVGPQPRRPARRDPVAVLFAALRHPEHAALIGRAGDPAKRGERALVELPPARRGRRAAGQPGPLAPPGPARPRPARPSAADGRASASSARSTSKTSTSAPAPSCTAPARAGRNAPPPDQADRHGDEGLPRRTRRPGHRSCLCRTRRQPSAETRSGAWSNGTLPRQPGPAHRSRGKNPPRTRSGTPAPCVFSKAGLISQRSACG